MKHIDILIHVICLLSGIITALLGFLLYLKYKIKAIWNYALFILTTTFTVAATTFYSYVSYYVNLSQNSLVQAAGTLIFGILLALINYAFTLFALGIMNKPLGIFNKVTIGIPWLITIISFFTLLYHYIGKKGVQMPPVLNICTGLILIILFFSFVIYSIQIAFNLKYIDNLDLKRALKVLALLIIIVIPLQMLIIIFLKQTVIIFLTRNLFYFAINITSIIFAAKYFFIETPSITGPIEISGHFINKFAITGREKEVIELLLSGLFIKEISAKLGRSFKTVNNHIYNIYRKTSVSSKLELLNLIKEK